MSDPFEEAGRRIGQAIRRGPPIETHRPGCTCGHERCSRIDLLGVDLLGATYEPEPETGAVLRVNTERATYSATPPIVDPAGLWAPPGATPEDLARRKRIRDAMDKASKRKPRNNRGRK